MKDFFQQGKSRFFSNYWNYLAIATQAFFYVIRWACRTLLSSKQHSTAWEITCRRSRILDLVDFRVLSGRRNSIGIRPELFIYSSQFQHWSAVTGFQRDVKRCSKVLLLLLFHISRVCRKLYAAVLAI